MNTFCQSSHETSIYKIRLWKSADKFETNVFIGKNHKENKILKKIETHTTLTETDKKKLKSTFGENFKNKLGVTTPGPIRFIYESIYADDNINTLMKKISMYLLKDTSENDLYLWIQKEIKKSETFIAMITSQLLKGKKTVSLNHVKQVFLDYFDIDVKFEKDYEHRITEDEIVSMIKKLTIPYVHEPLGSKYLYDQFSHYFQINPFLNKSDSIDKNFEVVTDRSLTLEHFQLRGNIINVAVYEHVKFYNTDILPLYFNWHDKKTKSKSDDIFKTSDIVHDEVSKKIKSLNEKDFATECHVTYLHLRLNDQSLNPDIQLKHIYDNITTSVTVPFIKYNTPTNKYYKVDKSALSPKSAYRIPKADFDMWTELNPNDIRIKSIQEYIMFKVFLPTTSDQNKFVSVLLFPDTHIDIKYNIKTNDVVSFDDISKNLKEINSLLSKVKQYMNDNVAIPEIDNNFWYKANGFTNVKIVNISSYVKMVCTSSNSTLRDVKTLAKSLFPFISVSENEKKSDDKILYLQYKRIDNFVKTDNISNYLNHNMFESKDEAVTKIREEFALSENEAILAYEHWTTSKKVELVPVGKGMYFRPANASNVMIKIKKSSLGYKAMIEGVTKLKYHKRIVSLLKFLSYYGAKDKLKTLSFITTYDKDVEKEYDAELFKEDEMEEDLYAKIGDVLKLSEDGDAEDGDNDDMLYKIDELEDMGDMGFDDFDIGDLGDDDEIFKEKKTKKTKEITDDDDDNEILADDDIIVDEEERINELRKNPDTFQYVLNKLKATDKKLFVGTKEKPVKYSTRCQWSNKRQPLVITPEDKENIDKLYPGSYDDNYIEFGSDKTKMKKNIYICPEIWCPISKVSMTYKQFVENGKKCPAKDIDEPVINMIDNYWMNDKKERKPRYIGFTGDGKDCFPCCFLKKPEIKNGKKNNNKEKIDKCLGTDSVKPTKEVVPSVSKSALKSVVTDVTEKYIVSTQYPLDVNRYGILPKALSEMFQNKKCGSSGEGTGLIVEGTDCFVRKGIVHVQGQSFLSCMKAILLPDEDIDLNYMPKLIKNNLTLELFVMLNDGNLCGLFINEQKTIFDPKEFMLFRKWFLNSDRKDYIETFNLYKVRKDLIDNSAEGLTKFNKNNFTHFKHILREYIIYNSYHNFLAYLEDEQIHKSHDILIDLFNRQLPWLNAQGYNIIVFEVGKEDIHMSCPLNTQKGIDLSKKFIFLVKQEDYYEPICKVQQLSGRNTINSDIVFKYGGGNDVVGEIIDYYRNNCKLSKSKTKTNGAAIMAYLDLIGVNVRFQVINYNFKLEGFLVKGGMFIPCKHQSPIIKKNARMIYIDDMVSEVKEVDVDKIKPILKALDDIVGDDFYKLSKVLVNADNKAVSLTTQNGNTIPLTKKMFPMEHYLDNLNLFIGWEEDDTRKIFIENESSKEMIYKMLKNEIWKIFENHKIVKHEVDFLRSPSNPFPLEFKKNKMNHLVRQFLKRLVIEIEKEEDIKPIGDKNSCFALTKTNCKGVCQWYDGRCYVNVPKEWLNKFQSKLTNVMISSRIKRFEKHELEDNKKKSSEVIFDQKDVIAGRITKIQEVLRDPYKFFDRILDDYVNDIIEKDVKIKKTVNLTNVFTTQWRNLPIKFNKSFNYKPDYDINKSITGFAINENPILQFDFIPNLFTLISKLINSQLKITPEIVSKLIINRLIKDYIYFTAENKLTDFIQDMSTKNLTFGYYVKKRKTLSLPEMQEIFQKPDYAMSEYELSVLANLLGIKVIILARKGLRNPNEIKCIKPAKTTNKFIMLFQITEESKTKVPYDRYEVIVKDISNPQIVFYEEDEININKETLTEYIKRLCVKYYVLADMNENSS